MDCRIARAQLGTAASIHGPSMKRESQPPLAAAGNAGGGTNRNAEKYQRILDAAVAVFADKGFFNSRISDIADRADVADGTVYLYFKNKEEILMTAINTAFDAFMRHARTEVEKLPSPAERLRRLAFLHLDALGSNRNLAVVFQMEFRQSTRFLSEFSHHHMVEYLSLVRAAIAEGQANGSFSPRHVRQNRGQLFLWSARRDGDLLGAEWTRVSAVQCGGFGGRYFSQRDAKRRKSGGGCHRGSIGPAHRAGLPGCSTAIDVIDHSLLGSGATNIWV